MKTLVFETPWQHLFDGWCTAARAYARAMALSGLDVHLKAWDTDPHTPLDPAVAREIPESMRAPVEAWDAHLFSTPLGGPANHRRVGTFEFFHALNKPPRFLYTMFERRNVQPELIAEFNRLEGVFVPCSANLRVLEAAGCTTATWIPYPYFDDDPHLSLPPARSQPRTLLWIGRWEPRKAPHNLIRAFLRAFKPGEARLILKMGPSPWVRSQYPEPESVIAEEIDLGAWKRWKLSQVVAAIEVVRGRLSAEEMLALHARADTYVSASRGEGIELGMFAAKLAGRRVVTTDCGGPLDFLGEDDSIVPAPESMAAPDYEWLWGPDTTYARYELDDLVAAMQSAMAGAPRSRPERVPPAHRAERVGQAMRAWIEQCSADKR